MIPIDGSVVERTPLESAGVTGARLERLVLADGQVLVEKTVDPRTDWLMQATGDDGRIFRLWSAGVFGRLPEGVDSAVLTVEARPEDWVVRMRDVSDSLVPAGRLLSRRRSRQATAAASRMHDAFAGTRVDHLCPIVDRLSILTPSTVRGLADHPFRDAVLAGWERFAEVVPADVGAAVLDLLRRPGQLAAALDQFPATLLHGDLKVANLGFDGSTVILLDWGTVTGTGPRALDHAWYLAVNGAAVDADLDELLGDAEEHLSPEDRGAMPLALLGQLVMLGWDKALGATSDDAATRTRERAGLRWWCDRADAALERWSPA